MSWRTAFNRWRRALLRRTLWRTLFGERSQGVERARTRLSPLAVIEHEDRLVLGEDVYVGPFNLLEASGGIELGDGVQVTSHVVVTTHSSHRAQRLLGAAFATWPVPPGGARPGWIAGPVRIGAYSFLGPHSVIEAGSTLGRGTIVRAGSVVRGEFPDFAVLEGAPARVVGDSREGDARWLDDHPELRPLYDAWAREAEPPAR